MGRPKLGNVLFAKRVPKEMVPRLESFLRACKAKDGASVCHESQIAPNAKESVVMVVLGDGPEPKYDKLKPMGPPATNPTIEGYKRNIKDLLEDVERLTKEREVFEGRIQEFEVKRQNWMLADESTKVRFLAGELAKVRASLANKNEFDQT